jgi:1,4-dihydroxy-2-naphthoyl-CoA hydrolase
VLRSRVAQQRPRWRLATAKSVAVSRPCCIILAGFSGWQTENMTAELDALIALMPFAGQLGITLLDASADRVIAELAWAPGLCTSGGVMHGGALMTLADSAGALVAFLGLPDGATTATVTSTTQLFRPVRQGTVRAVSVPLHRGRTMATVQTTLLDSADRLVAQTTQIQAIRPGHG